MTPFEAAVLSGWLKSMTLILKLLGGGLIAWGLIALAERAYWLRPGTPRLVARVALVFVGIALVMLLLVIFAVSLDMADNPGKYRLPAEAVR